MIVYRQLFLLNSRCSPKIIWGNHNYVQGDHFSGKSGHVQDFDICQVKSELTKSQGNIRKISVVGKTVYC